MDSLLDDIRDDFPSSLSPEVKPSVLCIGGKWEIDALAGKMLAHALAFEGIAAVSQPAASVNADYLANLDLKGADIVCLSYFTPNPAIPVRHACRRLRRRSPNLRIVLALWNAPPDLLTDESLAALKADAVVTSVEEAVRRIHRIAAPEEARAAQQAPDTVIEGIAHQMHHGFEKTLDNSLVGFRGLTNSLSAIQSSAPRMMARSSPVRSTTPALTMRPPSSISCRVRLRRSTCHARISCRALAAC